MIALSAVECNALCSRCEAVRGRSDQQITKRHTACVCSFETRFDGPVCLHYFALLQHFSSIRTRLNNRRSTSLSSTQRKRSLGRMPQWINDRDLDPVTLSPCHPSLGRVQQWFYDRDLVTRSPCHPVNLSPCHPLSPFLTRFPSPESSAQIHNIAAHCPLASLSSLKLLHQFSCVSCLSWFPLMADMNVPQDLLIG